MASKTSFYNNSGITNTQINAIDAAVANAASSATAAALSQSNAAASSASASASLATTNQYYRRFEASMSHGYPTTSYLQMGIVYLCGLHTARQQGIVKNN